MFPSTRLLLSMHRTVNSTLYAGTALLLPTASGVV